MMMSGVAREGVTEVLRALRRRLTMTAAPQTCRGRSAVAALTDASRIVIKIGSALLVDRATGSCGLIG